MQTPPSKLARTRKWTPHSRNKRYCLCRQPWNDRAMVQCQGRCGEWFHNECVAPTDAELKGKYFCKQCTAKGEEWLREPTYCSCERPWDNRFMLECDDCHVWFHGSCVGVTKRASTLLETWRCAACSIQAVERSRACTAAVPPPPRASFELPLLSDDLWAHILTFVPVTDRVRSVATVSLKFLAAVDATFEPWCRSHSISLPPQSVRPSRFRPPPIIATHCPWLHAVQTHGCRCCLEFVGAYLCKRDPTVQTVTGALGPVCARDSCAWRAAAPRSTAGAPTVSPLSRRCVSPRRDAERKAPSYAERALPRPRPASSIA
jgi:hypothetical protein